MLEQDKIKENTDIMHNSNANKNVNIKKNDEFETDIIDYGSDGEGVAKIDGYTIFVKGALKGEKCKIHITKVLQTHAF